MDEIVRKFGEHLEWPKAVHSLDKPYLGTFGAADWKSELSHVGVGEYTCIILHLLQLYDDIIYNYIIMYIYIYVII